jgi:hypothetical protein
MLLILIFMIYWWSTRNRLTVINRSGQSVENLIVKVSGEEFDLGNLQTEMSSRVHFRVEHEALFDISFRLSDGTLISDCVGYIVWEDAIFGARAKLVIQERGSLSFFNGSN